MEAEQERLAQLEAEAEAERQRIAKAEAEKKRKEARAAEAERLRLEREAQEAKAERERLAQEATEAEKLDAESQGPTEPEPEQAETAAPDAGNEMTGAAVVAPETSDEATASETEETKVTATIQDDKLFLQAEKENSKSGASSLAATAVAFVAAALII